MSRTNVHGCRYSFRLPNGYVFVPHSLWLLMDPFQRSSPSRPSVLGWAYLSAMVAAVAALNTCCSMRRPPSCALTQTDTPKSFLRCTYATNYACWAVHVSRIMHHTHIGGDYRRARSARQLSRIFAAYIWHLCRI